MVEENLKLVYHVLKKFNLSFDEEAFSYAAEGLFLAANSYSNTSGKFSTYAYVCIYNKICEYLRIKYKTDVPVGEVFDEGSVDNSLEVNDAIRYVVNTYSGPKRLIIDTWFSVDFSQAETARVTGYSAAHVNQTILNFRSKLRKELEV